VQRGVGYAHQVQDRWRQVNVGSQRVAHGDGDDTVTGDDQRDVDTRMTDVATVAEPDPGIAEALAVVRGDHQECPAREFVEL